VLFSEEEFLGSVGAAYRVLGRLCHRAAVKVCTPVSREMPVAAPVSGTTGMSVSGNSGNSFTPTMGNMTFTPHIHNHFVIPQSEPVNVLKKPEPPPKAKRDDRPEDPQKRQSSVAALFGKPPPSFTGLSDEKVLHMVNWAPVSSGGHTEGSKISVFRNKFMADFVRKNPNLVFDNETAKKIRAESLKAYEERQSDTQNNLEEFGSAEFSGLWLKGPEAEDAKMLNRNGEKEDEAHMACDDSPAAAAAGEELRGNKREVAQEEGELPQMKLKAAQAKLLARKKPRTGEAEDATRQEEDLAAVGSESAQSAPEAAAEDVRLENSGKRPLLEVESSEGSSSSEVDLVQEAVNPGSKSYNIPHLKVSGSILWSV
jgi:hypothetical protein